MVQNIVKVWLMYCLWPIRCFLLPTRAYDFICFCFKMTQRILPRFQKLLPFLSKQKIVCGKNIMQVIDPTHLSAE